MAGFSSSNNTACKKVLNPLEAGYLTPHEVVIERAAASGVLSPRLHTGALPIDHNSVLFLTDPEYRKVASHIVDQPLHYT